MKSKIGVLLLAGMLCMGGGVNVFAQDVSAEEGHEIQPQYVVINSFDCTLTITKGGTAYYEVNVSADDINKISVKMELQKKIGSKWTSLKSKTFTSYNCDDEFEDSCEVDDVSADYRVYYKISAYYGSGQSEIISKYEYC